MKNEILKRLREDPGQVEQLVSLLVEDLLNRPVREMLDPAWLAPRFVAGFRATVNESRTEEWVQAQVGAALARVQREQGTLRDRVPAEWVNPARHLASRAYQPDRVLVRAILDHKAMHKLLREVLMQTLTEFGRSLKPSASAQAPKKRGTLGQLLGAATEVASAVGGVMEKQVEGKVREFVDGAIGRSLDQTVSAICAESFVPDFAEWRAGIFDKLLDVDFERYLTEVEKLDPDGLVKEISALLRALAAWDGLGEQVQSLLAEVVEETGEIRLREFLDGSGLEEEWRPQVEAFLVDRARDFVGSPSFAAWLTALVA